MRSEQEMFDLICGMANADEQIRAAYLNGSRANPRVKKDVYQDYDLVFVVRETGPFLADRGWLSAFGEPAMVQEPDSPAFGWGKGHDPARSYTWLMLFRDGVRIDLSIKTPACALDEMGDTLSVKLLDKDNLLPPFPEPGDSGYWIQPPTREEYDGCCNEFWWCLNNVAKGLARDQMPYAQRMYHQTVHVELDRMVEWYIGMQHDFTLSTGMWGKYFKQFLPPDLYEGYLRTYADADAAHLWEAVSHACALFGRLGVFISGAGGAEHAGIPRLGETPPPRNRTEQINKASGCHAAKAAWRPFRFWGRTRSSFQTAAYNI